ncbi:MAG: TlyA family RNA methyltransferase [Spirochaetaceae bacterium]|nr:MAG: TlyA family RNA methyltransferase [Spirochaetaceae bacterium]
MERLLRVLRQREPDTPPKELYARIVCGQIYVNGERVRDPAAAVEPGAAIEYRRRRYVSRGGDKLHAALAEWRIPVAGKVFLDAGASSGGFTDCLLQFGAACVHAVDVGYNQLDYRLRSDPRVAVHERTNLMTLPALDPPADAAVADLSFRSLHGAAGKLLSLSADGWAIVLVKPQFELAAALRRRSTPSRSAGSVRDAEGGVVRDRGVLLQTLLRLAGQLDSDRIAVRRVLASPIAGRRGNREFLFLIARAGADPPGAGQSAAEAEIRRAVAQLD